MTSLFHFEDKVHHKNLTRVESTPLLFSRLLCQVLEHMGFTVEPRLERRRDCKAILIVNRWKLLPRARHLPPQDLVEDIAVDQPAEDIEEPHIAPSAAPTVTGPLPLSLASSVPPVPPAHTASVGPSTSVPPPQHISISTRDFLTITDAVRTFSATSASFAAAHIALTERMTRTETAIANNHSILVQIQSHLGLPPISPSVPTQASSNQPPAMPAAATHPAPTTASLDMLAAAAEDSPLASSEAPQPT